MASRQERLAENQRLFRDANERFEELIGARVDGRGPVPFLCECADLDCRDRIELKTSDYDAAHVDAAQYVILPGHGMIDGEEVVEDNGDYFVVRKDSN
jgi:hypothetical protein